MTYLKSLAFTLVIAITATASAYAQNYSGIQTLQLQIGTSQSTSLIANVVSYPWLTAINLGNTTLYAKVGNGILTATNGDTPINVNACAVFALNGSSNFAVISPANDSRVRILQSDVRPNTCGLPPATPLASNSIPGLAQCDGSTTTCDPTTGVVSAIAGGSAGINQLTGDTTAGPGSGSQPSITHAIGGKAVSLSGSFNTTGAASGITFAFPTGGPFLYNMPSANDTLVGRTSIDTLTNKTVNCANNVCTVRIGLDVSGLGTNVGTALGTNVGLAGSFVVNGGALGTPLSGNAANLTGLPIATGVSGLGTGIATALGVNAGTAGSPVINGGVLGTPSSGSLTNLTGLPITGIAGLGAGVATWLATPTGANLTTALGSGGGTVNFLRADGAFAVPAGGGNVSAGGALTNNQLVIGQGTSAVAALGSLGTTTTLLHGNAAGLPSFGAAALGSDVTGILPIINGGSGTATPGLVAGTNVTISGSWPNQTVNSTGGGGVSSVGLSVPATSIFGATGTPVTTSGTLGLTTTGTSGGIPYFSSGTQLATSGALTANALVTGGGPGVAPTVLGSLGTTTTLLHGNAAGAPTFGAVSLTGDVTGILPAANGGTANGFAAFSGPATTTKTFTLPNASATILTNNAAVTVGQGGTGIASGTSGGIPYYSSTSTIASSGALPANLPVIGGGAGVAPTTGTRSGNTTSFATTSGTLTSGNCARFDASGNVVDNGTTCGGAGSVSVTAATPNTVITPSPGTGAFTVGSTAPQHDISGSGTAIVTGDNTQTDLLGAFTYTLAQAGQPGFTSGWSACLLNIGAGNATINTTTSIFKGAGNSTSLVLVPNAWACPQSDGTNYQTAIGQNLVAGSNITITPNANGTTTVASSGAGSAAPVIPQGRLTLTANTPVMTADAVAQTTLRYDSYQGNQVPVWNGSAMVGLTITLDEITMGLSATNHPASGVFDIFAVNNSSSLALCTAQWTNSTTRASAISLKNGVWTITAAPTHCWGGAAGATDLVSTIAAANEATLLGCFMTTATNGQTAMQLNPAAASGGTNNWLGLDNIYNKVLTVSLNTDNVTYAPNGLGTWGPAHASNNNRITFVDCLGQGASEGTLNQNLVTTGTYFASGTDLDSTSTAPVQFQNAAGFSTSVNTGNTSAFAFPPALGQHFVQEVEFSGGGATATAGAGTLTLRRQM